METRQRIGSLGHSGPSITQAADSFLATVRGEHGRLLEAMSRAGAGLGSDQEQLALASAAQVQLTRQFFDAQRSILGQRAQADAELAEIGSVRSSDVAHLAATVNDDLLSTQKQQLAALLDEWWTSECRVRQLVVCEARAAVQQYLARFIANQDEGTTAPDVATVRGSSDEPTLPPRAAIILDQLETADVGELQALLGALIDSLDAPGTPDDTSTGPSKEAQLPVRDVTGDLHFVEEAATDEFGQFWTHTAPEQTPTRLRRRWFIPHGLVPVAAVASALTVAMAWIG